MQEQSVKSPLSSGLRRGLLAVVIFSLLISTEFLATRTNWISLPGSLAKKSTTHGHQIRDKNHSSLPESLRSPTGKSTDRKSLEHPSVHLRGLPSIELPDAESIERLGIQTTPVQTREMVEFVETTGVIDYDQTRMVKISSKVPGTVWRVEKEAGDQVRKGELLAILEAARVGEAKSAFLQAIVQTRFRQNTLERLKQVSEVVTEREIREADAALREARIKQVNSQQSLTNLGLPVTFTIEPDLDEKELIRKIQFLGLPESIVKTLDPDSTPASLIPVTAPFDGIVTERNLSLGEVVESSNSLFSVADVTRMWIILSVRKEDADRIQVKQPLIFSGDNQTEEIRGSVQWISPEVHAETRTVEVRGEVENPFLSSGRASQVSLLRTMVKHVSGQSQRSMHAHTFGRGKIQVRHRSDSAAVPQAAVQSLDDRSIVFVVEHDSLRYAPRVIRKGIVHDGYIEILEGVKQGENVVTIGSHVLKSELSLRLMKNVAQ